MITPLLLLGMWFFWRPLDWVGSVQIHWVVLLAALFGALQALSLLWIPIRFIIIFQYLKNGWKQEGSLGVSSAQRQQTNLANRR